MPSFVKSKYSKEFNSELRVRAMSVLSDAGESLTIPEICQSDLTLTYQTPQKMARVLSELVEDGFIARDNKNGRMAYKCVK